MVTSRASWVMLFSILGDNIVFIVRRQQLSVGHPRVVMRFTVYTAASLRANVAEHMRLGQGVSLQSAHLSPDDPERCLHKIALVRLDKRSCLQHQSSITSS